MKINPSHLFNLKKSFESFLIYKNSQTLKGEFANMTKIKLKLK